MVGWKHYHQNACSHDLHPCPIPNLYVWEVRVDNKTVHIEASNRMFAFLKARIKYRHAKHIRVVKLLKTNRYA